MKSLIKTLLPDGPFRVELMQAIDSRQDQKKLAKLKTCFKLSRDGNIVEINGLRLGSKVLGQLSYLIGSINFLFGLIDESVNSSGSPDQKKELVSHKVELVILMIGFLSDLSKIDSMELIGEIIDRVGAAKMALKMNSSLKEV